MPFRGFEDVAGGGGSMVGGMRYNDGKVNVQFISGRSETVEAELRYLRLPESKWQEGGRKTFDVRVDEPTAWEVGLGMETPGTYVLSVMVKDDKGEQFYTITFSIVGGRVCDLPEDIPLIGCGDSLTVGRRSEIGHFAVPGFNATVAIRHSSEKEGGRPGILVNTDGFGGGLFWAPPAGVC